MITFPFCAFAQLKSDTLPAYQKVPEEKKITSLLKLVREIQDTHPNEAIDHAREALFLSLEANHKELAAEAFYELGLTFGILSEYDSLLKYQQKAYDLWHEIGNIKWTGKALRQIALYYYSNVQNDTALLLIQRALNYFEQANYTEGRILCTVMLGNIERWKGEYENAIRYYQQALQSAKENKMAHLDKSILNYLGLTYVNMGLDDRAMEYYYKAARAYEKASKPGDFPIQYLNIAWVLQRRGQYESAGNYLQKYYDIVSETNIPLQMITYKLNAAYLYYHSGQLEKSMNFAKEVYAFYKEKKRYNMQFLAMELLAKIHAANKDFTNAELICMDGLRQAQKISYNFWVNDFLNYLALYAFRKGEYKKSINFAKKGLTGATSGREYDNVRDSYFYLSQVYAAQNQYDSSLFYYKLHTSYRDSITNKETENKIAGLQIKYETELKEQQIEKLSLENSLNKQTIRKQYYAGLAVVLGLISIVIISLALYRSRQRERKINQWLEEEVRKRTNQLQEAKIDLENAYGELKGLDTAKNIFLRIISHEIRTPLNGIIGSAELLKSSVKEDSEIWDYVKMLNESAGRLERFSSKALTITELKTNYRIKKENIEIRELIQQAIADNSRHKKNKGIRFVTEYELQKPIITADKKLSQQALNDVLDNAAKYSPENEIVRIMAREKGRYIAIEIQDKGKGFSNKAMKSLFEPFAIGEEHQDNNIGLSLRAVKQIMEIQQGKIEITNLIEGGALVSLYFPNK